MFAPANQHASRLIGGGAKCGEPQSRTRFGSAFEALRAAGFRTIATKRLSESGKIFHATPYRPSEIFTLVAFAGEKGYGGQLNSRSSTVDVRFSPSAFEIVTPDLSS